VKDETGMDEEVFDGRYELGKMDLQPITWQTYKNFFPTEGAPVTKKYKHTYTTGHARTCSCASALSRLVCTLSQAYALFRNTCHNPSEMPINVFVRARVIFPLIN